MTTPVAIDTKVLERALKVSGETTNEAAVTRALEEFIAHREQRKPLDLFGKLEWDETYDYKADRRARDRKHGLID